MNRDQVKEKIAKGLAWEALGKSLMQIFSWVVTIVVAGYVGPSGYGLVAISGLFVLTLSLISELGITTALVTEKDLTIEKQSSAFWCGLAVSLSLYGLLWSLAPAISRYYGIAELQSIVRVAGLTLFISAVRSVPMALLLRDMDLVGRARNELVAAITQSLVALVLAMLGFGAWSLVLAHVVSQCVATGLIIPRMSNPGPPRIDVASLRGILPLGLRVTGSRLVGQTLSMADTAIVSAQATSALTGQYAMALQLTSMPLDKFGSIISRVIFPAYAALSNSDSNAEQFALKIHFWLLAAIAPLSVGLPLVANELVSMFFSERWDSVASVILLLMPWAIFRASSVVFYPILEGARRGRFLLFYSVACIPVVIPSILIGAKFGVHGVAIAQSISALLLWIPLTHVTLTTIQISWRHFWKSLYPIFGSLLFMVLAVFAARQEFAESSVTIRLFVSVALGGIVYSTCLVLMTPRKSLVQLAALVARIRT